MSGRSEIESRPGSPRRGSSTLMTSAPCQARASVQDGPASNCVRSTTVSPDSGASVMAFLLIKGRAAASFVLEARSLPPPNRPGKPGG